MNQTANAPCLKKYFVFFVMDYEGRKKEDKLTFHIVLLPFQYLFFLMNLGRSECNFIHFNNSIF